MFSIAFLGAIPDPFRIRFYWLRVISLRVAALRDRREDIHVLINHFITKFSQKFDRQVTLSMEALDVLQSCTFPGNVRELIHLREQIVVMGAREVMRASDLPAYARKHKKAIAILAIRNLYVGYLFPNHKNNSFNTSPK